MKRREKGDERPHNNNRILSDGVRAKTKEHTPASFATFLRNLE